MSLLFQPSYTMLKSLYIQAQNNLDQLIGKNETVKGWIRTTRKQKDLLFIQMYDGSHCVPLQLIFDDKIKQLRDFIEPFAHAGACLEANGTIVKSPAKGQLIEMQVINCKILGPVMEPKTYLPCGKKIPMEYPRRMQHVRPKFRLYGSIYRIRSCLMKTVQDFFHLTDCFHLDVNTLVSSDAEGAGETLTVTTLLNDGDILKIPTLPNSTKIDFKKDIFDNETPTSLTVSSQLQLEALCSGMGRVYTTNKSYRAEKSKTKRHLCEFTHIEAEFAFMDLDQLMNYCEDLLTYCIKGLLKDCRDDLEALNSFYAKGIIQKLESFVKERFARITYDEAIDLIHKNKNKIKEKFKEETINGEKGTDGGKNYFPPSLEKNDKSLSSTDLSFSSIAIPKYGDDLGSYCERFITEDIFKKPVCVHHYPKDMKSFYMKQCEPYEVKKENAPVEKYQNVKNFDLIVPYLGELIGGSEREENYDKLLEEMKRRKMCIDNYSWYLDLRKNGSTPSSGFGCGFDRLVTMCTSAREQGNIRDNVTFVVAYQDLKY